MERGGARSRPVQSRPGRLGTSNVMFSVSDVVPATSCVRPESILMRPRSSQNLGDTPSDSGPGFLPSPTGCLLSWLVGVVVKSDPPVMTKELHRGANGRVGSRVRGRAQNPTCWMATNCGSHEACWPLCLAPLDNLRRAFGRDLRISFRARPACLRAPRDASRFAGCSNSRQDHCSRGALGRRSGETATFDMKRPTTAAFGETFVVSEGLRVGEVLL